MNAETNKRTIRVIREDALSTGNLALLDGLYSLGYHYHGGETFGELEGSQAFQIVASAFRQAIDGLTEHVVEQIAEGDRVLTRIEGKGTAVGEVLGVAGGGRDIKWTAMVLTRFDEAGLIAEEWIEADALGIVRQLTAS